VRILFTNTGSWGTGSFTVTDLIALQLKKLGHQVKIFFPDNGFNTADKPKYYNNHDLYEIWPFPIEKDVVKIPYFPRMLPGRHPRGNGTLDTLKNFSPEQFKVYFELLEARLKQAIETYQPDVIDSQHVWAFGYTLAKLKYQYILGAHNSDQMAFTYDQRMQEKALLAAHNSKYIFAVSETVRQTALKLYNVPPEKVVVMPVCYNENKFKKLSITRDQFLESLGLKLPKDARLVTFSGLITLIKGIDILLKANALLDPKVHILLFGAGNINDVIDQSNPQQFCLDRVHSLGHQSQETLAKAFNISDLFVLPSRREGFPITILEAMACGIPAVAGSGYGAEEVIAGEIFQNENPASLAAAITKILDLPAAQYQELTEQALAKSKNYTSRNAVQNRLPYYQSLSNI